LIGFDDETWSFLTLFGVEAKIVDVREEGTATRW
jgi:hypothetical protein